MKEKTINKKDERLKSGDDKCSLILYNDNINTFAYVIKSLVEICGHDSVQAEQCAIIVHLKGSCEIKSGIKEVLLSMSRLLNSKGLTSRVESL